jgi:hypothetical protein
MPGKLRNLLSQLPLRLALATIYASRYCLKSRSERCPKILELQQPYTITLVYTAHWCLLLECVVSNRFIWFQLKSKL